MENTGNKVIRVAITGPESTGKSALAEYLARYFQTRFVPEYARGYIANMRRAYGYKDLNYIAHQQLVSERYFERRATGFVFCDTDLTVIKIWSEHRYGKCSSWVLKRLGEIRYDLYLLCDVDLPWEADPQREHPEMREHFMNLYRKELEERGVNFRVISGLGEERFENAVKACEDFMLPQ